MSTLIPLEDVRVASPCRADWNLMDGDERVRFCQSCTKNVYNLSAMSKTEAEQLIAEKEGKLCVRYFQRADGTIMTDNCPVGLKIVRRPFKFLLMGFATLLASGAAIVAKETSTPSVTQANTGTRVCNVPFVRALINRIEGNSTTAVAGGITMGKPAPPIMGEIPAPSPTPTPKPEK